MQSMQTMQTIQSMQAIQSMQSKQPKRSKQSKQSQDKVINEPRSTNYEFKDESNYSSTNKMYASVYSQISNISVRRRSNGLDYDKKNSSNVHSDIEVTIGIMLYYILLL